MNPQELAKVIEELILNADARYATALKSVQQKLYSQVVAILKDLELDAEGYMLQNSVNRKILSIADKKINEFFNSGLYVSAVTNYVSVIPKIDIQNVKYFTSIKEGFKPNRVFLKNLQTETIATIEKYILQDGLQSQVIGPLRQILNQNINSGGKFAGFLDQVRDYIVGNPEAEGRAMSYTRTYLRDSLFTYSRTFQQAVTSDLGLKWFRYVGGIIDKTRDFCLERNNNYYSKSEVESWASLTWAGRKSGTTESTIFQFCGGWNCSHQIIPVSKLIVPKEVIDRQIEVEMQ